MMMSYHWPGNVRELENCIEHSVLTSTDDVIHAYNLPPSLQTARETHTEMIPAEGASLETLVNSYEREILVDAPQSQPGKLCRGSTRPQLPLSVNSITASRSSTSNPAATASVANP